MGTLRIRGKIIYIEMGKSETLYILINSNYNFHLQFKPRRNGPNSYLDSAKIGIPLGFDHIGEPECSRDVLESTDTQQREDLYDLGLFYYSKERKKQHKGELFLLNPT